MFFVSEHASVNWLENIYWIVQMQVYHFILRTFLNLHNKILSLLKNILEYFILHVILIKQLCRLLKNSSITHG